MPDMLEPKGFYFDNTRVSSFFKCPRLYYFRHMRSWQKDGGRIALTFGGAWHVMMEIVWARAYEDISNSDLVDAADVGFKERWRKDGYDPDGINLDDKRNPGLARDMCFEYVKKYRDWLKEIHVLCIEQPFVIPLGTLPDGTPFYYIGRWDKAWLDKMRHVYVGEHKTTSLYRVKGIFAAEFLESFSPDNQVDGYQFGGLAAFGEAFKGVMIDACMVHKTVRGFTKIPVRRALATLKAWVWEATYWINEIYDNACLLAEMGDEEEFLKAFPKRTEQCQHKYGMCSCIEICKYGDPNPERIKEVPDGFKFEPWDPFAHNVEEGQVPMGVGDGTKLIEQLKADGRI